MKVEFSSKCECKIGTRSRCDHKDVFNDPIYNEYLIMNDLLKSYYHLLRKKDAK